MAKRWQKTTLACPFQRLPRKQAGGIIPVLQTVGPPCPRTLVRLASRAGSYSKGQDFMAELPRGFQLIQECEAAIVRIRAAIAAGAGNADTVGDDWDFIQRSVQPRFVSYARRLRWMGGHVFEEALLAMNERLFDNIWSTTFPSLETGFGSYLRHMPQRILQETARKYRPDGVSSLIEHLDETVGEDGQSLHELVEDPRAEAEVNTLADRQDVREAIAQLPALEQEVVMLRLQDVDNGTIARRFEVAPATATRIWQRALAMLRQSLISPEE